MPVLAEPLERTAVLLPLAPAVGFWFMQQLAPTDMPWSLTEQTPLLWFSMGVFYAVLAATRRSLVCTVLAASRSIFRCGSPCTNTRSASSTIRKCGSFRLPWPGWWPNSSIAAG